MTYLHRRELLVAAGALTLASAAPARSARSPLRPRRTIRKALKIGMIEGGGTLEETFQIAKDAGFDGVELNSPSDLALDDVLAAIDATGLVVPGVVDSVHWSQPLSHPDPEVRAAGVRGLEQALRDCKAYGGDTVLLVPAVVNGDVSYDAAYERSQAEIRRVLPLAEELGIKIALENVWNSFLLSPIEAARYVDELESPWVGWYFDVGNIVNYGWPEQWVRILGPRILKLDVKEFSRKKRNDEGLWKGFAVEIGDGDCNWPAVMTALDEIGFGADTPGWASAEVAGGDAARLRDIAERMERVLGS